MQSNGAKHIHQVALVSDVQLSYFGRRLAKKSGVTLVAIFCLFEGEIKVRTKPFST